MSNTANVLAPRRRYTIIHGHFYQPPRENPWLDSIERQPSASPYHDWNERIYAECYRPNAFSRLLDSKGMITGIHNNYENLSFNFGPTLFKWLQREHPKIARRIIEADHESALRLGGHGNALAQVYNHIIMPLASRRDQLTQIRWAKEYFRSCFNREAEGIWLAETAINMETISCLIEEQIRFVVLSPTQAQAIRLLDGSSDWTIHDNTIDTRKPYRMYSYTSDGTRTDGFIDVFIFNEALSREISFGDILRDAHRLGDRINICYNAAAQDNEAVVIATDGETFGHHKPLSDMCLAYFFRHVASEMDIIPVNFGWYLEHNPPTEEVVLKNVHGEGTSWSCAHGVGRWIRNCGCKTGGAPQWQQEWRFPFRQSLVYLQQEVDAVYERYLTPLCADPWAVRDKYLAIASQESPEALRKILKNQAGCTSLTEEQAITIRRLLEAQKFMLFAFTSCGWFFSDISGIESVQNIAYAMRALQLGLHLGLHNEAFNNVRSTFLAMLDTAKSNRASITGKTLYHEHVAHNMRHLAIIAFTAAAERKILLEGKSDIWTMQYHGYTAGLSFLEQYRSMMETGYSLFNVDIQKDDMVERAHLYVLTHQSKDTEFKGWILPDTLAENPAFTMHDPAQWVIANDVVALDLSSIFEESKNILRQHFLAQIARDTHHKYHAWFESNEKLITSLYALAEAVPDYVVAPISYVVNWEWNTILQGLLVGGREDAVFTRLTMQWNRSRRYKIKIDFSISKKVLEDLLNKELTAFSATLSFAACRRIEYLLDVVDRFGIPVTKNRFEDALYGLLMSTMREAYAVVVTSHPVLEKDREHLVRLLDFARRMNFNTDEFPIVR